MPHIEKLYGYDLRDVSAHERISKIQTETANTIKEVNENIYIAVEESKTDNTKAIEAISKHNADAIEKAKQDTLDIIAKNKTYVTPQEYGAVGDGVADDTAAIQNALNIMDVHVTIPRGVYKISGPLYLYEDYAVTLELRDGALIRATTADPMIVIVKGSNNRPGMKCCVMGNGILDMNNIASQGILLKASTRYAQIRNIDVANIGNATGIQVGESGEGETASTLIDSVTVTGKAGTPVGSVGILVYHHDCQLTNIKVIRCYTGIDLKGAFNQLTNVHCWSDHPVTSSDFANAVGVNVEAISQLNNIYCDSYSTGVRAITNVYINNMYYYLGDGLGTPETEIPVQCIKASATPAVHVNGLEVHKKTGFIIDPVRLTGKGVYIYTNSWRRVKMKHGISYVDGFNPVSEAFNLRLCDFATSLNHDSSSGTAPTTPILVGYISKTYGFNDITITYDGYWRGTLKVNLVRGGTLDTSCASWTVEDGDASGVTIEIGEAVTIDGLEYYPVFMKKNTNYYCYVDVEYSGVGNAAFYLNARKTLEECYYSEAYTPIVTFTN